MKIANCQLQFGNVAEVRLDRNNNRAAIIRRVRFTFGSPSVGGSICNLQFAIGNLQSPHK